MGGDAAVTVQMRVGEIWAKVKTFMSVEPVIALYLFGLVAATGNGVFARQKACATKLGYDLPVCEFFSELEDDNICNKTDDGNRKLPGVANFTEFRSLVCAANEEVVEPLAVLDSYSNPIDGIVTLLVLLFAGSWSDRSGLRKPCILLPIVAEGLSLLLTILSAFFMKEIPLEVAVIGGTLITALSGGPSLVVTGVFSYLSVCTAEKDRTFRFFCTTVIYSSVPIVAGFLSGPLYKYIGFINLCFLCFATNTMAILYGLFVLKEPKELQNPDGKQSGNASEKLPTISLRQLFDVTLVKDLVKVFVKKRDFNCRKILYLSVLVYFVNYGGLNDDYSAKQIAFSDFKWITQYGVWKSYDRLTTLLGTMLVMGVLSKRLGVSDPLICVFSVCFSMVAKPIMAMAVEPIRPYLYYVATSIDVFEGSRFVAIKSIVSKLVPADDIAKVISILGIVDSAQTIVFPPIFNMFFAQTYYTFKGTVFLLTEAFLLVSLGLYIWLHLMSRRSNREKAAAQTKTGTKHGIDNPAVDTSAL